MEDSARVEDEKKQKIHAYLRQAGHEVETVEPNTHETPFPLTKEFLDVGGSVVGGFIKDIAGGSSIRTTQSKNPFQLWKERLFSKKRPNEEIREVNNS